MRYSCVMPKHFLPNIDRNGRIVRAVLGTLLVVGGVAALFWRPWPGLALLAFGGFVLFEASRGWCVVRACGIKTKI